MSKHLFLAHSHATYRSALGVIDFKKLNPSACIIVRVNGFVCNNPPEGVSIVEIRSVGRPNVNSVRRAFEYRRGLKERDNEITELMDGETYHCYISHTYYDFARLIVTHPKCSGFSYMEEGLTSYYQPGEIAKAYTPWSFPGRVKLLRKLFFGRRLEDKIGFFADDYEVCYGFTEESFPGWRDKVAIGIDKLFPTIKKDKPDHPPVLVFDALVELGMTTADLLCEAIDQFFQVCKKKGDTTIYFKFHPGQNEEQSIKVIREAMARHPELNLHQLAKEVCLEDLFTDYHLKVFVFNSASGLYAALVGQEVASLNPLLESVDPSYRKSSQALPEIYNHLVSRISVDNT
jgi:hypothetical protein